MLYRIETHDRKAGDRTGPVVELHGPNGCRAEIWTAHGFNCLRYAVGEGYECVFSMPNWEEDPVPTRSGIPILAPFPNRIKDGRFSWNGRKYQLPLNDSSKKNAIHGEAPRHPWRIVETRSDEKSAWVAGAFSPAIDAPQLLDRWTGDYQLRVVWRLKASSESVTLGFAYVMENRSTEAMPFGLGLHPYLRHPTLEAFEEVDDLVFECPVRYQYESMENLPTGKRVPLAPAFDFRQPRQLDSTAFDHLFGLHEGERPTTMVSHGRIMHPSRPGTLEVLASPEFGDTVLFTPAHRKALCIEPYTCVTDAVNWANSALPSGLIMIKPGQIWGGAVEFLWKPGE